MELRRTVILIALAVVSYFLFLNWQQDYAPKPEAAPVAEEQAVAVDNPAVTAGAAASVDVPQAVATTPAASDVPVAVTPPSQALAETAKVSAERGTGGVVRVSTDVLNVDIDINGGDIVRVALPAFTRTVDDKTPFVLLDRKPGYSYIAQSGLVRGISAAAHGLQGLDDAASGRPQYQSEQTAYSLEQGADSLKVVLRTTTADGLQVSKIFGFQRGDYRIHVSYEITNPTTQPWSGVLFGQIKRDGSKDPSSENHSFGMVTFLGGAWWTPEKNYNKLALDKFGSEPLSQTVTGGWVAMVQHYFVSAWVPAKTGTSHISTRSAANGTENYIGFTGSQLTVAPGGTGKIGADFYAGPKHQDKLEALSPGLELTVDYGFLWPIAQFLFWLLQTIHGFLGNWGWSIVVLTLLVKAAFFHLSAASYRSMANMRRVMPEMQRMKEKFGSDRAKLSQAMMELYKKEKINPLGGCLPILVQMPVFIALYWTLMESVELRHAGWILWIKDLSLMDPYFILPLLMGVTMYVQQQLNPAPQDPVQAKVLKMMPIVFTIFFLWFPAGLVLYWFVNNLLSIAQQWVITRQIEKAAAAKSAS